jgi:DNA-binding response OmpR family regulator
MRLLVVEDERRLAELIARRFRSEHYEVDLAYEGDDGLVRARSGGYDAIVLDRMLPGIDGIEICRRLRCAKVETPILMLTARRELQERVEGLDAGADDYLGKPFAFSELLARVRALTRRAERPLLPNVLQIADLSLDMQRHRVELAGAEVELSPREFALLEYLMRNAGQVVTREQILDRVWGYDAEPEGNVIDLYIHYLRRKLDVARPEPLIKTVRGVGYTIRA